MLVEVDKVSIQRRGYRPFWMGSQPLFSVKVKCNQTESPVVSVNNRRSCRIGLVFETNASEDQLALVLTLNNEIVNIPLVLDTFVIPVLFKNYKVTIFVRVIDRPYFSLYEMNSLQMSLTDPSDLVPNIQSFSTYYSTKNGLIKRYLYDGNSYKVNPKTFEVTDYFPILQNPIIAEAHRYTLSLLKVGITKSSKEDEAFLRNLRRLRSSPKMFISIFFHISLEASRESILHSLYRLYANPCYKKDLYKRITVKFVGEMGEDHGALRKEFFELAGNEIVQDSRFSLVKGLFDLATSSELADEARPKKYVLDVTDTQFYSFVGFFIGHVIFQQVQISVRFTKRFYMALLKKESTYNDITDETLKNSIDWIKNNSVSTMDFVFKSNKLVNNSNKNEFIKELIYEETFGKFPGYSSMAQGFAKAVSDVIFSFEPHHLERLLSGVAQISVSHLKSLAVYRDCTVNTEEVVNFWRILESSNEQFKRDLLRFVTGSSSLQNIPGSVSECIIITQIKIKGSLPTANTCFRRLVLYKYSSYSELKNKLERSIKENGGFHFI
ncbi:E3 ubiquitin ligase SMURF1/2 [Nematocida ausubeli]|nr:E3 ubiquitin ligase SMURF1/2 [Nematocida ausubeli]